VRLEEPLILEALQRGRDRADRVSAPRPLEDLAAYLYSARRTEARDGEECRELEALGQSWFARTFHKYDYVVQIATAQVLSTQRP
jgi:hypothetical protein